MKQCLNGMTDALTGKAVLFTDATLNDFLQYARDYFSNDNDFTICDCNLYDLYAPEDGDIAILLTVHDKAFDSYLKLEYPLLTKEKLILEPTFI